MAYPPPKLENFGLENHCKGRVTPTGLCCLTHSSLWYLKRRPLIDHNLFIFLFQRSAPSKERSRCVHKMKPLVWTIDTCTGAKGKRPVPTHLILTSSKSPRGWATDRPQSSINLTREEQAQRTSSATQGTGHTSLEMWPNPRRGMEIIRLWERQQREHTNELKGRALTNSDPQPVYISWWGKIRHFQQASVWSLCCSQATLIVTELSWLCKLCLQTGISYFLNTLTCKTSITEVDDLRFIFTNKETKAGEYQVF